MPVKLISGAAFALLAIAGVVFTIPSTEGGCTLTNARPCYDKIKSGSISILRKNAENAFSSCVSNSAPNEKGTATLMTAQCTGEEMSYAYCYEGKSHVYMRKFTGACTPAPVPPPEPTPAFKIVAPNGGEVLPFGSSFPIRWEGGRTDWKVSFSIVQDNQVKRNLIDAANPLANDKSEDWLVDLPPGKYTLSATICLDTLCSQKEWDYSDTAFEVVAGAPLGRVVSSYPTNHGMVVLMPSTGGDSWQASTTHELYWSGAASSSSIKLSLIDAALNVVHSTIAENTENDGKYTWTIPNGVMPGAYTLSVQCNECLRTTSLYYNYSFKPFSITQ